MPMCNSRCKSLISLRNFHLPKLGNGLHSCTCNFARNSLILLDFVPGTRFAFLGGVPQPPTPRTPAMPRPFWQDPDTAHVAGFYCLSLFHFGGAPSDAVDVTGNATGGVALETLRYLTSNTLADGVR